MSSKDNLQERGDSVRTITNTTEPSEIPVSDQELKVKKALKIGHFNDELRQNSKWLDDFINGEGASLEVTNKLRYLKIQCMLAEVYDYFGTIGFSNPDLLKKQGFEIFDELRKLKDIKPYDRKVVREQVRFCLNHANAFLYRAYKYDEAEERISWCRKFVIERLRDESAFPCYGTLAQAEFLLGRIYRRLNQYDDAEKCFGQAIAYYYKRAKRKKEAHEHDESKQEAVREELTFSEYKSAICLGMGIGWISYSRGHLSEAIYHGIIPARVLLLGTQDKLHTAYLDLLMGAAQRAIIGPRDKSSLEPKKDLLEAIENIERAYQVFHEHKHVPYMANAALELALAYLYNEDYYKAANTLSEMESALKEEDISRWQCPRLLLLSRISREKGNLAEAESLASESLAHAKDTWQISYQIEALTVRSEAKMLTDKIGEARADLHEALKLNGEGKKRANPKVEAVCQLHLARSYALEHNGREAKRHFGRWKPLEHKVEHRIIHEIARKVEKEIEALNRDFVIPADTEDLNYNEHLKRLQKFLINQAKQRTETIQDATKKLKISRQTLHQWQKEKKS